MSEMQRFIAEIADGRHLDLPDAGRMFQIIMTGGATPAQIAAVLMGFRLNGETVEEISGAAMALRSKAKKLKVPEEYRHRIVDTCGTGGDSKGTYNISTTVALVVAACGIPVVKHGNKAISSKSGSADVLSALGVNIELDELNSVNALVEANICFLMAPLYHSAMRHVAPVRQELAMRTIFNLLGPLINPAMPERQLLGVYAKEWVEPLAKVLDHLGSLHAWVVHGADGMDEMTTMDDTYVAELKDGEVKTFTIVPEDFGFERPDPEELKGGDAVHNAKELRAVLKGVEGPYRDIVLLNAGAALVVGGKVADLKEGIALAAEVIDDGTAMKTLAKLVEVTNA